MGDKHEEERTIAACGSCGAQVFGVWLSQEDRLAREDAGSVFLFVTGSPAGTARADGAVLTLVFHDAPCGLACAGGELPATVFTGELEVHQLDGCPRCPRDARGAWASPVEA